MQSPTFGGQSFGSVGQFKLIQRTITGEVDPYNPQNASIVRFQKAVAVTMAAKTAKRQQAKRQRLTIRLEGTNLLLLCALVLFA